MAETIGVEGRGRVLRLRRRAARRRAEPPAAGRHPDGHGAADRARRRQPARREGQGAAADARHRRRPRWCGASTAGYRDEPGVDAGLARPRRYVAARLEIDSWRWAGVPWYVRAGKAHGRRTSPRRWSSCSQPPAPAVRRRRDDAARTRTSSASGWARPTASRSPCRPRRPGQELETKEVDLSVDFAAALGERQEPYERLLADALEGNPAPLRPPGRRRADVADRAAGARRPRARSTRTSGAAGVPRAADALLEGGHWHWEQEPDPRPPGGSHEAGGRSTAGRAPLAERDRHLAGRSPLGGGGRAGRRPPGRERRDARRPPPSSRSPSSRCPWEQVHVWQVDERVAPDGDPDRNATGLREHLLAGCPLADEQVHLIDVDRRPTSRHAAAALRRRAPAAVQRGARRRPPRPRRRRPHRQLAAGRPGRRHRRPRRGRGGAVQRAACG